MAEDAAGLQSQVVQSDAILVDVTPPEGVTCTNFSLQEEVTLTVMDTSTLHEKHTADILLDAKERGHVFRVEVRGASLRHSALGVVRLQQLHVPLVFRFPPTGGAVAEHDLLTPDSGDLSLQVEVEAPPGATITARLYRCETTVLSPDQAVTLHQTSSSSVSVCARILDLESGVKSMLVGLGTTAGGLQVVPWTHVTHVGHVTLPVRVQQSSPLFATVVTQNHAGQWARFISQPVTFDLTPPHIHDLAVTLTYQGEDLHNGSVNAEATWTFEDPESGLESCACLMGEQ
jgi:hypothetical protein